MHHKISIIGRVGRDPETRYTQSGNEVTTFSIASNTVRKNNDGTTIKNTTWFRIAAFGQHAKNVANYVKRGDLLFVEGTLMADDETGGPRVFKRKDGTCGAAFDVAMRLFIIMQKKDGQEDRLQPEYGGENEPPF